MVDKKLIKWYCCIFTQWGNRVQQAKAASRYAVKCPRIKYYRRNDQTCLTLMNIVLFSVGQGVDTLLSETGAQQGEAVGKYLRDIPFNNVIVSNLQRAMQVRQTHSFLIMAVLKYPGITSRLQSGHHTHRLCDSDRSITALLLLSADCLKQVVYWSVRLCGLVAVSGDILYLSSHQKEQGTDPLSDLSLPLLSRD